MEPVHEAVKSCSIKAGGTFYFHRRSQQKLDKLKPGEVRSGPARRAGSEGETTAHRV